MTRREFDPVFSDALRSELERLSVAEGRPARAIALPVPDALGARRSGWMRQGAIAGITLAVVIGASVGAIRLASPDQGPAVVQTPVPTAPPSVAPSPAPLPTALQPPAVHGKVVGTASGTDQGASGRMSSPVTSLNVTITCQGEGFLTIQMSDGFTFDATETGTDQPNECSATTPRRTDTGVSDGAGMQQYGRMKYTITPHGRMVWVVTFSDGK